MFEIEWIEHDIINVRLSGFFSVNEMMSLEIATERLLLTKPVGEFFGLAELCLFPVQRPDVLFRLRDLLSKLRAAGMANGAMVVKSMLVKIQTRRVVDTTRAAYFNDRKEALHWLSIQRSILI